MNQLIDGIRLFTGVDEHVIEDGVVWVSGDRIQFAGSVSYTHLTVPTIYSV